MIWSRSLEQTRPLLGACLAVHHAPRFRLRQTAALLPAVCLAAGLPLVLAWGRFAAGWSDFGPVAAAAWSRPWLLLALAGGLVCALLALRLVLVSQRRVEAHTQGLLIYRAGDWLGWLLPQPRELLWSELRGVSIETIEKGGKGRRRTRLVLYPKQGVPLIFWGRSGEALKAGEIAELFELSLRLKDNLYTRLQPEMLAAFNDGNVLWFGGLSLSKDFLKPGRFAPRLPWDQVRRIHVQHGRLVVEFNPEAHSRRKITVPVSRIPNLELFLHAAAQGELHV
jgi:hypothetical protein